MKKWPAAIVQFLKFGMVGALNTVLSYLISNLCYYIMQLHEQVSNFIAFVITVLISYLLNRRFVFRQEEGERQSGCQPWYQALAKVYASYALTELVLAGVLLFVQERLMGIPHFIAAFVNLCATVPLNFLLNKYWAYRKRR